MKTFFKVTIFHNSDNTPILYKTTNNIYFIYLEESQRYNSVIMLNKSDPITTLWFFSKKKKSSTLLDEEKDKEIDGYNYEKQEKDWKWVLLVD